MQNSPESVAHLKIEDEKDGIMQYRETEQSLMEKRRIVVELLRRAVRRKAEERGRNREEHFTVEDRGPTRPGTMVGLRNPGKLAWDDRSWDEKDRSLAQFVYLLKEHYRIQLWFATQSALSTQTAGPSSVRIESSLWPQLGIFKHPRLGPSKCSHCRRMGLRCEPQMG